MSRARSSARARAAGLALPRRKPLRVELHAHTTASDGLLTPEELVALAGVCGVGLLAVTDHDTLDGYDLAALAVPATALEVWPGIELSSDGGGAEVHILGYRVDPKHAGLRSLLESRREARAARAAEIVAKLATLGAAVSLARVREIAGDGVIGRPHIAQALLEAGHVASQPEAFDRFIGHAGPAFVVTTQLTPIAAIETISAAGGVAVLAHPTFAVPSADPARPADQL